MEKRLKNITIAILAIAASGAASAAMYTPAPAPACTPGAVTTPCESSAWGLGIEGLYVQPTGTSGYVFRNHYITNGGIRTVNRVEELTNDPKWAWGFRIDGTYQFGQGSDLSLNWTHFQKNTENSHRGGGLFSPFIVDRNNNAVLFDGIRTNNDIKFDAVNLEFGQRLIVGDRARLRYHAGLQYANMRSNVSTFGFDLVENRIENGLVVDFDRKFQGIGPRAGVDMSYDLGNGFALVGKAAGTVLVGTSNFDARAFARRNGQQVINSIARFDGASHRNIIPGAELQAGAKYTYAAPAGDFSIEAGWKAASYSNALRTATLVNAKENFGYQGPYLGLKWLGNA